MSQNNTMRELLIENNADVEGALLSVHFKYWILLSYYRYRYEGCPDFEEGVPDYMDIKVSNSDLLSLVKDIPTDEVKRLDNKATRSQTIGFIEGVYATLNLMDVPFNKVESMLGHMGDPDTLVEMPPSDYVYEVLHSWL